MYTSYDITISILYTYSYVYSIDMCDGQESSCYIWNKEK